MKYFPKSHILFYIRYFYSIEVNLSVQGVN